MKIAFIPSVEVDPANTERTPKLLYLLSNWYNVVPIQASKLDKVVYDQKGNKFSRYLLFVLNELLLIWSTLRKGKEEKFSAVFAEGSYYALAGGIAARILGVPLIWDNHGNIKDFAATMGKSRFFTMGNLALERVLADLSSIVLVVSDREIEAYGAMGFDTSKFRVIPTCADIAMVESRCLPREEAKKALGIDPATNVMLFFGTLKYLPNRDAASYLSREVMSVINDRVPGTELYIAGSGTLGEEVPSNVHLLGFVPDLYLWLSAADLCVAPMWKGVGILTKVIDMLSAGRATVVSPLAVEGIPELRHGVNCRIGTDRASFTDEVSSLLLDREERDRLGSAGKELILTSYSWEVVSPRLREIIESNAGGPTST